MDQRIIDSVGQLFSRILHEWLPPAEMEQVVERNAVQTDPLICHSHDFCDANMAMDQAMRDHHFDMTISEEGMEDSLILVWNAAWGVAKKSGFKLDPNVEILCDKIHDIQRAQKIFAVVKLGSKFAQTQDSAQFQLELEQNTFLNSLLSPLAGDSLQASITAPRVENAIDHILLLEHTHLELLTEFGDSFNGSEAEMAMSSLAFYLCREQGIDLEQDGGYCLKATADEICEYNIQRVQGKALIDSLVGTRVQTEDGYVFAKQHDGSFSDGDMLIVPNEFNLWNFGGNYVILEEPDMNMVSAAKPDNSATLYVYHDGDSSVGISGDHAEVKLMDLGGYSDEDRIAFVEHAKEVLGEAFTQLWGFKAKVEPQTQQTPAAGAGGPKL